MEDSKLPMSLKLMLEFIRAQQKTSLGKQMAQHTWSLQVGAFLKDCFTWTYTVWYVIKIKEKNGFHNMQCTTKVDLTFALVFSLTSESQGNNP